MRKTIEVIGAAVLFGTATLASASTPTQFADEFSVLQSYSGTGPMYHPAPTFSNRADDPSTGLTERTTQALSNGDPVWQPNAPAAPLTPTFAQTNPRGLSFAYYQAAASNSDEFKLAPNSGAPAYATAWEGDVSPSHAAAHGVKVG